MNSKLILHIDENHPLLIKGLERLGYENHIAYTTPLEDVLKLLPKYSGIVIRSRFPIDKNFIDCATNLKFIARVGAGLENIDMAYAQSKK
jgi:D-3-phosphoglycerate dehydrogenase